MCFQLNLVKSELKTDKNRRIHILVEEVEEVVGAAQTIEMRVSKQEEIKQH